MWWAVQGDDEQVGKERYRLQPMPDGAQEGHEEKPRRMIDSERCELCGTVWVFQAKCQAACAHCGFRRSCSD